ncbi:MAG: LUD domain-containing protein [Candidatus Symbiothrix sp.]|jgi:L-lactate dehydrogenase complex protein LldG|nr:LUD domain-containing protein [Candidatus Symbiothrix sp.]
MTKVDILQSIRKRRPVFPILSPDNFEPLPVALPGSLIEWFKKSLKTAGAEIIELKNTELDSHIAAAWPTILDFTQPKIRAEYPASAPLDKLNKIEHALFAGNFGVAENGAIWIEDKDLPHRILPFITQHLILKLDAGKIVATMQEAYQQFKLNDIEFGVFISGPSKTADIEQSLVYGAHGAKELTVILVTLNQKNITHND